MSGPDLQAVVVGAGAVVVEAATGWVSTAPPTVVTVSEPQVVASAAATAMAARASGRWRTFLTMERRAVEGESATLRAGDVAVVNKGKEHSLTTEEGCQFIEALSPVPVDHVPDGERDLVLGAMGDSAHVER